MKELEFVREMRPGPLVDPVVRFETPPGLQAQAVFAEFRLPWGKRFALVVVMGYSRLMWLQFYPRQTLAVPIRGLYTAKLGLKEHGEICVNSAIYR